MYAIRSYYGIKALQMLRDLGKNIKAENYDFNPIKVYEKMTLTDDYLYSPFAYGYTNYSRRGYARKPLKFHDMVVLNGQGLITTLGGTGLAVSAKCQQKEIAVKFAEFVITSYSIHYTKLYELNTKHFTLLEKTPHSVTYTGDLNIRNYGGYIFNLSINRKLSLLTKDSIESELGITVNEELKQVAYSAQTWMTNNGKEKWTQEKGLLSIWEIGCMKSYNFV